MTLENQIFSLFYSGNYILLFFLLLAEGPIIGFIASHLSSMGYLNIFLVFIIYFLGDLLGDILHYFIGIFLSKTHNRFFKKKFVKIDSLLKSKNVRYMDKLIEKDLFLALLVIKLTPPISSIGLISLGIRKTNILKFIKNTAVICLMVEIPIVLLGYFTGISAQTFLKFQSFYGKAIFLIIVTVICIYLMNLMKKYISKKIIKKEN